MGEWELITALLVATLRAGTPLVFAALGELIAEKAGVLNLGVEGMMLVGAVAGFIGAVESGSFTLGALAGLAAGAALSLVFGVLTLSLRANQVATGLALTIFGVGLSAFVGLGYVGQPLGGLSAIEVPLLSEIPVIGPVFFAQDFLVYLSYGAFAAILWFLYRSRGGLILRAVGEAPEAAHALGHKVILVRYLAVLFGGAMAGLGGAYLSLVYTPQWSENMTAGRGWIALALVVFAAWRPPLVLVGAWLFGGITILGLHAQAQGEAVAIGDGAAWALLAASAGLLAAASYLLFRERKLPVLAGLVVNMVWLLAALASLGLVLRVLDISFSSQLIAMVPYIATVMALVLISWDRTKIRLNAPAALGKSFHPSE